MISKAYVFLEGLESQPIVCGVFELDSVKGVGRFRYGKSYLNRDDAFALDPINMPLDNREHQTLFNKGVFGALADAGADAWGKKVILSLHTTKPKNALEFLLAGAGMGVGALVFSLSSQQSKPKRSKNTLGQLPILLQGKDAILADAEMPREAKKAFEYGSSMGGARPKTTVFDQSTAYLAKFNRPDDLINVVKVEHATMNMLAELPCRVAKTKVLDSANGDTLLVERFDTKDGRPTHHYLSCNSLFHLNKVSEASLMSRYHYGTLAEFLLQNSGNPEDALELYYRMAFNVLIGNTDDHTRNHAVLYDFKLRHWRLSPAYDVLPINSSRLHGMGIGEQGRQATIDNLLSSAKRFGLSEQCAKQVVQRTQELVVQWPTYFAKLGVGSGDLERLKAIIPNVP